MPGFTTTLNLYKPDYLESGSATATALNNNWDAIDQAIDDLQSGGGGVTDHGDLLGRGDDDHPQYYNEARALTMFYTEAEMDALLALKANATHQHAATDITSGVIPPEQLGSGTPDNTKFLRGDGSWQVGVGGAPSGAAGGALSGSYPNPTFAVDMATQAELDAHLTDPTAAHAASAISVAPTGTITSTTVQAAIAELDAAVVAGSGTPATGQGTYLVSGGEVTWTGTGLVFRVGAADYYINGTRYTSAAGNVTLAAADATHPRIDMIALDVAGPTVETGVAAADPLEPALDPTAQLRLQFVTVAAAATTPTVTLETVYAENAEWTGVSSAGTIVLNSTAQPNAGTVSVNATAAVNGTNVVWTRSSTFDPNAYAYLVMQLRPKAGYQGTLRFRFYAANKARGVAYDVTTAAINTASLTYQTVAIPMSAFAIPAGTVVDKLRLDVVLTSGTTGFYLDDLKLQTGTQPVTGTDTKDVKATSTDNAPGTLNQKIAVTGGLTKTTLNAGGNEQIQLSTTGLAALTGGTFTGDISVPDEAYGVGWNGSLEVPTKNALYDKIETLGGGGGGGGDLLAANNLSELANKATARENLGVEIGVDVQAYDLDLATIAALAPSNDDIIQRKAGAWTNRTMAQLKTDLALGNVDNTSDASKPVSTQQQAALDLKANLAGATFTADIIVPDEAYDATAWNGSMEVPTKNAVRDKIESIGGGAPGAHATTHLSNGTDAIPAATTSVGGLMSAADKTKLDAMDYGYLPFAMSYGASATAAFSSGSATAAGVGALIPVVLDAPMLLESVSIRNNDTTLTRSWEWRLYREPAGGGGTLDEIPNANGSESFTASATSTRTAALAGGGTVTLAPGLYWLAFRNTQGTNSFTLGIGSAGSLASSLYQTKVAVGAFGATLDAATGWSKQTTIAGARLNGRVFGAASAF